MNECDRSSNRLATVKLLLAHAQLLHKRYTGVLLDTISTWIHYDPIIDTSPITSAFCCAPISALIRQR